MSLQTARTNVLSAEKDVTTILAQYGEDSTEYKKSLKNFAKSWLVLTKREDQINNILED